MKISIINKLVIGALVASFVSGCGGSGAVRSVTGFKGISVSTYNGHSVKSVANMNGADEAVTDMPSNFSPTCHAINAAGELFVGTLQGAVVHFSNPGGHDEELAVPAGKSIGVIRGIAIDQSGLIYINDTTNRKVYRVNDMSGAGWAELDYSAFMADQGGDLDETDSLAVDSMNRIYIASRNLGKIYRFMSMGDWSPTSFGTLGSGVNKFGDINDLHIDAQDRIYVADRQNDKIVRIDDMTGKNWATFGTSGSGVQQLDNPTAVTTDSGGRIYVTDIANQRIVRIDNMTGSGWVTFGSIGTGPGKFEAMMDILVR